MVNELVNIIKSGARTNKYRVTIPIIESEFSKDFDLTVFSTSFPSKTIVPVEVMIKGRKVQMRGETSLENTWDVTFYNTDNLEARKVILDWMNQIHRNKWDINQQNFLTDTLDSIKNVWDRVENIIEDPLNFFEGGYIHYQRDIIVEQLDQNGDPIFGTVLIGAFPINVSTVELDDSISDISKTTVTFAFNDIYYESKGEDISYDDIRDAFSPF
jgi:hypothetical protein